MAEQSSSDIFEHDRNRKDVGLQTAMAKAMELRTLHSALMNNGRSPTHVSSSPAAYYNNNNNYVLRQSSSAPRDYPVFNPSYGTEPLLPDYKQILLENPIYKETWEYHQHKNGEPINVLEPRISPSLPGNMPTPRHHTKGSSGDFTIMSANSCNKYEPTNVSMPEYKPKHRRHMSLSWLFLGLKKKKKTKKDSEADNESTDSLKKELIQALRSRDTALNQVEEMKSSVVELSEKLAYLEAYCDELKKALALERPINFPPKPIDDFTKNEAMTEELLRSVSESRQSVKQFCKALLLLQQTEGIFDGLNSLLQPYNLSLTSKHRKTLLYHVEAVINQTFFQDFENPAFHKSGSPKFLDPREDRASKYESFAALKDLSLDAILRKGSKHYDADFRQFCDRKMRDVVELLGSADGPWGEELAGAFYGSAKWVWLVHLLAFSFDPSLGVVRVDEGRAFDGRYMEDVFDGGRRRSSDELRRVKVMVMPGFYVGDRVVRCKVLCRYKSVAS